jgi:membrane protein
MLRRSWVLTKHVFKSYQRDHAPQHAAAISYYVLFSLAPLAIVAVSVAGFVLTDQMRTDLVNTILDAIPLSETDGRSAVEDAIESVRRVGGPAAVVGLLAMLWTASSMFAAIRRALNVVWDIAEPRPWFQGKLIDFAQIGMLSVVMLSSLVATLILRGVREASAGAFGPLAADNPLWELPPIVVPAVLSFCTFVLIYRVVPETHPHWRDIVPGALVGTVLFEALKNLFALYVANFNSYDVVYGSLAGVLLFLLFVHLAASILLVGAEVARVAERYHAGELDPEIYPTGPQTPIAVQALRAFRGLFVRQ